MNEILYPSKIARPRARRTYQCDECRGQILPGDAYVRIEGALYGEWHVFRRCEPCSTVCDAIDVDRCSDELVALGGLVEEIRLDDRELSDEERAVLERYAAAELAACP